MSSLFVVVVCRRCLSLASVCPRCLSLLSVVVVFRRCFSLLLFVVAACGRVFSSLFFVVIVCRRWFSSMFCVVINCLTSMFVAVGFRSCLSSLLYLSLFVVVACRRC